MHVLTESCTCLCVWCYNMPTGHPLSCRGCGTDEQMALNWTKNGHDDEIWSKVDIWCASTSSCSDAFKKCYASLVDRISKYPKGEVSPQVGL